MISRRAAAAIVAAVIALAGITFAGITFAGMAGPAQAVPSATAADCPVNPQPLTTAQADRVWSIAADRLASLAGPRTYPFGATGTSRYVRTSQYAWTSGFSSTSLWLMYERTKDQTWLARARDYTRPLLSVASWPGTHDLGFMVGEPAALAMRLDTDAERRASYATAITTAASTLSARWNGRVEAMRSAYYGGRWGLIIDSAMNAPLLLEAGRLQGGASGRRLVDRGHRHLLTLAREFVRPAGSTFHRLAFDPRTGRRTGVLYGQGLSSGSTWSRGQAWAVNGFTRGYALKNDARLLAAAHATADYWIAHVPAGCVPAWDLDVTDPTAPHDASAAAIAVDGLLALADVEPDASRAAGYRTYALTTLGTLTSPPWVRDRGRGILSGQAYNVPADSREGTYVWGDAYLLRALTRAGTTAPALTPTTAP